MYVSPMYWLIANAKQLFATTLKLPMIIGIELQQKSDYVYT
jgi:hypothetical protein